MLILSRYATIRPLPKSNGLHCSYHYEFEGHKKPATCEQCNILSHTKKGSLAGHLLQAAHDQTTFTHIQVEADLEV